MKMTLHTTTTKPNHKLNIGMISATTGSILTKLQTKTRLISIVSQPTKCIEFVVGGAGGVQSDFCVRPNLGLGWVELWLSWGCDKSSWILTKDFFQPQLFEPNLYLTITFLGNFF